MDISFLFGFLTGCLATGLGGWQVQKYTTNRKGALAIKNKKILDLDLLFQDYPHFMGLIKNDINNLVYKNVREFFVVDKEALINSSVPRFRYELTPDIMAPLNRLEELGFIEKLKNNCLHYKIEEEFIQQLRKG